MEIVLKTIILVSLITFFALFLFSIVIFAVHHKTGGAMFVPTPKVMVRMIVDEIDFSRFKDIRELGSGDGRFMAAVEKRYGHPVRGYEINPIAYLICRLKICLFRLASTVAYRSFFTEDLHGADCIFCYLFPDIMPKLGVKLGHELKEGALVISANFPVPGWRPDRILKCDHSIFNDPIYLYRIGSHLDGVRSHDRE
jgi:hypothetical protein